MDSLIKNVESNIKKEYEQMKKEGDIENQIKKIVREIRWSEPELALYVKKKMEKLMMEDGNSSAINCRMD